MGGRGGEAGGFEDDLLEGSGRVKVESSFVKKEA
jgi:hypothetical protein